MAAARLPQVLARYPHPLEVRRRALHPPQQVAVAALELVAPLQFAAGAADPRGEGVAHRLQLAQPERARSAAHGGHPGLDPDPWEGLRRELAELALEPTDLAAQLLPRKSLVATEAERRAVLS